MLYLMAILFVVDGHIPLTGELLNFGGLFRYYSFHMLMFAFGSGYFFHSDCSFGSALLKDCRRLLLPLYLYNIAYGLIAAFLRKGLGTEIGSSLSMYTLLIAPILDGQHFAYNLGAWFIGALFLVRTVYRALYNLCSRYMTAPDAGAAVLSFVLGSLAVYSARTFEVLPVMLPLLRAGILLPGYALGFLYRTRLERIDRMPTLPYLTILVLLRVLFTTIVPENAYLLSDLSYIPCGPAGIYLGGLLAIAFYLRIARILSVHIAGCRPLLYVSRHTFEIMMHHGLGLFVLNVGFLLLNWLHLGARDFSVLQLRTVVNYVYAPDGAPQWAALYLIFSIVFSCLIAWLTERAAGQIRQMIRK